MSDLKTAWTLIGGKVQVSGHVRPDVHLVGDLEVITVDHEDGRLEFTEDEVTNLIGALAVQLMENRRRRYWAAMAVKDPE